MRPLPDWFPDPKLTTDDTTQEGDPQAYLTDILKKLPTMTNHEAVELTPDKWKDQASQRSPRNAEINSHKKHKRPKGGRRPRRLFALLCDLCESPQQLGNSATQHLFLIPNLRSFAAISPSAGRFRT